MASDLTTLGADIVAALQGVLAGAYGKVQGQAEKEAHYFEAQAAMMAKARISGEYDQEQFDWFLAKLQQQAQNFCRLLCAQTILTIEEAWNAVVGVIWKAIGGALSAAGLGGLVVPGAPTA
ncbi:MAG TPA: hypothetical protein VL752_01120 [Acidisoma sp.]|jgi:hypothetical protein|uniref:hypothetical protein n=1 Tax=Acidisoma sp. TaxID=1872115 RepID=UPI002CE04635|nr:hypothetical protein [Acidisoma sp.]HTH99517.1 hypothetical protein [Acidisoma sp.]